MAELKEMSVSKVENTQDPEQLALKPVDTIHNDEAVKVLDAYDGDQSWTDAEEKKLCRKIDWRLMPVLCGTYGLQYYDKAMLSQAVSLYCIFIKTGLTMSCRPFLA